jgi:hypothetical protein
MRDRPGLACEPHGIRPLRPKCCPACGMRLNLSTVQAIWALELSRRAASGQLLLYGLRAKPCSRIAPPRNRLCQIGVEA